MTREHLEGLSQGTGVPDADLFKAEGCPNSVGYMHGLRSQNSYATHQPPRVDQEFYINAQASNSRFLKVSIKQSGAL